MMRFGPSALALASALVPWADGFAATLHVPEDFPTIQMAVDAAAVGDSVLVGPGTWSEGEIRSVVACGQARTRNAVVYLRPGVSVISTHGPGMTAIHGVDPPNVPTVSVLLLEDGPPALLEGFTVTSDEALLAHVCCTTRLDLVNCRFLDSDWSLPIELGGGTTTRFIDCEVSRCGEDWRYQAIRVTDSAAWPSPASVLEAIGSRFEDNPGAAISTDDLVGRVLLEDCEFIGNRHRAVGTSADEVTVRRCLFLDNSVTDQTNGALVIGRADALVEFCTFAHNSSIGSFGAALGISNYASAIVRNNTFYGGVTTSTIGSAIHLSTGASVLVSHNIAVGGNSAAFSKGPSANVLAGSGCNILWDNASNYYEWDENAMLTDIYEDPQFCDAENLDFTVSSDSPALAVHSPQCGAIGAHGEGCGVVSLEPRSWGRIKGAYRGGNDE